MVVDLVGHKIIIYEGREAPFAKMMMMIAIFANCKSVDWFPIIVARGAVLSNYAHERSRFFNARRH